MGAKMTRERAAEFGEWDFVAADASGQKVRTAGCDLLEFVGDKVAKKNAFRKQRG
jgi:hypothetical protein